MLTDEQINDRWREVNKRDDSWMPQIHWRFARAIESAVAAPLLAQIAELEKLSVTNIMLSLEPGEEGMGEEVFAKSVADVEDKLGKMGEELEDWQLGIKRHPEMEARIAELESQLAALQKKIEPNCPKCGDNRQVWSSQITGKKTCHRVYCQTEID